MQNKQIVIDELTKIKAIFPNINEPDEKTEAVEGGKKRGRKKKV